MLLMLLIRQQCQYSHGLPPTLRRTSRTQMPLFRSDGWGRKRGLNFKPASPSHLAREAALEKSKSPFRKTSLVNFKDNRLLSLACMEMRLIMGKLIWNYDMDYTDGYDEWDPKQDSKNVLSWIVWHKPGLNVKLTKVTR